MEGFLRKDMGARTAPLIEQCQPDTSKYSQNKIVLTFTDEPGILSLLGGVHSAPLLDLIKFFPIQTSFFPFSHYAIYIIFRATLFSFTNVSLSTTFNISDKDIKGLSTKSDHHHDSLMKLK